MEGVAIFFLLITIARGRIEGGVPHIIFDKIMLMNIKNFGRIKFYHNLMEVLQHIILNFNYITVCIILQNGLSNSKKEFGQLCVVCKII